MELHVHTPPTSALRGAYVVSRHNFTLTCLPVLQRYLHYISRCSRNIFFVFIMYLQYANPEVFEIQFVDLEEFYFVFITFLFCEPLLRKVI
jgi:hypothetical protein